MTDKEKIKAEIERLKESGCASPIVICDTLLAFIDSMQEEPVSKNKCNGCNNVKGCVTCVDGSEWAHYEEPVSEELEEELDSYIKDNFTIDKEQLDRFGLDEKDYMYSMDKSDMLAMVRHFTELQHKKDVVITEDLIATAFANGMADMKQRMMEKAIEVTVHIEAGNYPYIPQMELYDYDKDVPLAKGGDKVKIVVIKEEE